jgi:hypothetical protein
MTAQRQEANGITANSHFRRRMAAITAACVTALWCVAMTASPFVASAATTERVVTNRYSGLAIEGFDPLAYFIDGEPLAGSAEYEAREGGAVWRFRNEGNRASFLAHPEVYRPQFGGYDPVDVARGVTVAGNPLFWLVTGQRLYLFSRTENRDAFAANPAPFVKEALTKWPALEDKLAR